MFFDIEYLFRQLNMSKQQKCWVDSAIYERTISEPSPKLKHQLRDTLTPEFRIDYYHNRVEYVTPICV